VKRRDQVARLQRLDRHAPAVGHCDERAERAEPAEQGTVARTPTAAGPARSTGKSTAALATARQRGRFGPSRCKRHGPGHLGRRPLPPPAKLDSTAQRTRKLADRGHEACIQNVAVQSGPQIDALRPPGLDWCGNLRPLGA
jgi:hypothetical protein